MLANLFYSKLYLLNYIFIIVVRNNKHYRLLNGLITLTKFYEITSSYHVSIDKLLYDHGDGNFFYKFKVLQHFHYSLIIRVIYIQSRKFYWRKSIR